MCLNYLLKKVARQTGITSTLKAKKAAILALHGFSDVKANHARVAVQLLLKSVLRVEALTSVRSVKNFTIDLILHKRLGHGAV